MGWAGHKSGHKIVAAGFHPPQLTKKTDAYLVEAGGIEPPSGSFQPKRLHAYSVIYFLASFRPPLTGFLGSQPGLLFRSQTCQVLRGTYPANRRPTSTPRERAERTTALFTRLRRMRNRLRLLYFPTGLRAGETPACNLSINCPRRNHVAPFQRNDR